MCPEFIEVIISAEDAVFWLDAEGVWQNQHGAFEHKRISDYFNACIQKDEGGFFVSQICENIREKVYFRYEETAWVVVAVKRQDDIQLILNTKAQIDIDARRMFIKQDRLYMGYQDGCVTFTGRAMMQLADLLVEEADGRIYFHYQRQQFEVQTRSGFSSGG